jgi:cyanophycin synthetase
MDSFSCRTLAGPNLWSAMPVVIVVLPDEPLATRRQTRRLGAQLAAWLPGLTKHLGAQDTQSLDSRLARGLALSELLSVVISELHFVARSMRPRPRHWRERRRGSERIIVECEEPAVGRACAELAWRLIETALHERKEDVSADILTLIDRAYYACLGANTRPIVDAARARGIPIRRLDEESIVQFGHGARQRRMTTAMTDRISALAETITTNKDLTKRLLAEAGLPVPEGRVVASAEEAWQVARAIGEPVVVKPLDSDYGNGVSLNVHGREAVVAAYANARQWREQVIVERF